MNPLVDWHDQRRQSIPIPGAGFALNAGLIFVKLNGRMGAQWKQAGRESSAQKKGQMVVKLVREITVAAKLGGADPDLNPRLAAAVEKAKKASVYKETIERAIKKGAGLTDEKVTFETVVYEGFAPHKVPVVVECLTDNRNRTAPEIRNLFKAGSMGAPGSVSFFFNHLGVVEATHADAQPRRRGRRHRGGRAGNRAARSRGNRPKAKRARAS